MKSINKILFYLLVGLLIVSCQKDLLDKEPFDKISESAVWDDPSLVASYITDLYSEMLIEGRGPMTEYHFLSSFAGESIGAYNWLVMWPLQGGMNSGRDILEYWAYGEIRAMNEFFVKIENSAVDKELKDRYIAEVRFLRAYTYFQMVKRYGGVPLVTEPQQWTGDNVEELMVPRNKEQEIYDFIAAELDLAIDGLPGEYGNSDKGRVNKYAALALKSRAMLYAASIARYETRGTMLDGVVGIPATDANKYWKASYDASKEIIDSAMFQLFDNYADPVENYRNLFLESNHNEVIFSKISDGNDLGHNYDFWAFPLGFQSSLGYGNLINPCLELVEAYENSDGSPGTLTYTDISNDPILFVDPAQLFANKEPRFHASILYQNAPYRGEVLEIYSSIYNAVVDSIYNNPGVYFGIKDHVGKSGYGRNGDATKTGFYVLKYMSEQVSEYEESPQNWIVFRYAEILLNYAEAAYERGFTAEAMDAINEIRDRAGIAIHTSIDIDKIRHERRIELAFEGHRYWDLRRWRIAEAELTGDRHGLEPIMNWDGSQFSYYFERFTERTQNRRFGIEHYYLSLTNDKLNNNPSLVENPGY